MQKKALQQFSEGMNQDKSKTLDWSKSYYSATNIRLISDEGLSSGSIETVNGTRLEFKLPTLQARTYTLNNGTLEETPANPYASTIIGAVVINDDIIIVSADYETSPTGRTDQLYMVWKCVYDKATDTIKDLKANGELDEFKHLIYKRNLLTPKLGEYNYGYPKIIGKFETSKIQRIYWCEGKEAEAKVINTNLPFYTDPSTGLLVNEMQKVPAALTLLTPNVNFSVPKLETISSGNLPKGSIQYSYRLINSEGGLTRFSPASNLIDLTPGEINGNYNEYPLVIEDFFKGDTEETADNKKRIKEESNKSVTIKLDNLDNRYDYIQLCYIVYRDKNQPEIFLLPEEKFNSVTKSFVYTHSEMNENDIKINRDEFNALSNPFLGLETLETKDNNLLVANTKTPIFDIPLDVRAYRFDNGRLAKLYEEELYTDSPLILNGANLPNTPVSGLNTWGIAETLNLKNPFNDESYSNWNNAQYKYQADGKTFGGQGPNVKYSFTLNSEKVDTPEELIADNTATTPISKPFVSSPKHLLTDTVQIEGQGTSDGYIYNVGGSFKDLKSPYKANLFTGYARGEVYRFGIVFIDKKGNESFAKWIGDIRFPEFADLQNNVAEFDLSSYDGTNLKLYSLGINFEITIPEEIKSLISGFKIVRVERKEEWKTRLGTGVTGAFSTFTSLDAWTNLMENLREFVEIAYKIVSKASSLSGIANITNINDDFYDNIKGALDEFNPTGTNTGAAKLTREHFKHMIANALEAIKVPLTNISIFSSDNALKAAELIIEAMGDSIDFLIAGIDTKVKCLDGWSSYTTSLKQNVEGIADKNIGYVISPIISFDRYEYKNEDYLKVFKKYELVGWDKNTKEYHIDDSVGMLVRTQSRAAYRKWYRGTLLNEESDLLNLKYKRTIRYQNKMDIGEIVRGANSYNLDDYSYVNAHLGYIERYAKPADLRDVNIIQQAIKTLGIGDRKHFIVLNENMPRANYEKPFLESSDQGVVHTRVLDTSGDFMVSYNRIVKNQYNGNTYSERSNSKYIDCGHFLNVNTAGTYTCKIYGGDTTVALFDAVNYSYYYGKQPGYQKPRRIKKAKAEIFPVEVPFNINLRDGNHFAKSQDKDSLDEESRNSKKQRRKEANAYKKTGVLPDKIAELVGKKRFLHDDFILDDVFEQENNVRHYIPKPLLNTFDAENKIRIWKSKTKIDGELFDSWRKFHFNDFIDIDGNQGEIKDLQVLNNKLLAYQTRGIAIIASNERELTSGINGNPSTLGTVGYLSRYDYITKNTGVQTRFATCKTPNGIYHVDSSIKRIIKLSDKEGLIDVSFVDGMASFLNTFIDYSTITNDSGVLIGYNPKLSTVYFYISTFKDLPDYLYPFGILLTYNEKLSAFESFQSFDPQIMFNSADDFFSVSKIEGGPRTNKVYSHNKGKKGYFYGTYRDSTITFLLNDNPLVTKEFNNLVLDTECKDADGVELHETVNKLKVSSDYLDSDEVTLVPDSNIKRKFRSWTTLIPRANNSAAYTGFKPRMVDKNMFLTLKYTNNLDKRLIIHPIIYNYQDNEIQNR